MRSGRRRLKSKLNSSLTLHLILSFPKNSLFLLEIQCLLSPRVKTSCTFVYECWLTANRYRRGVCSQWW